MNKPEGLKKGTEDVMMTLSARNGSAEDNTFVFSVSRAAYQSFNRSTQYRWQEQSRLNRMPAQQFLGQGSDTINLAGVIYPHYRGGFLQVEKMRELAAKGKKLTLIAMIGTKAEVKGKWCINSVGEIQSEFTKHGIPLKMEFSLGLVAYGDDKKK